MQRKLLIENNAYAPTYECIEANKLWILRKLCAYSVLKNDKYCYHVSEGVMTITVSLMAGKAEVDYDPSRIQPKAIADHIAALGTVDIPTSFLKVPSGQVRSTREWYHWIGLPAQDRCRPHCCFRYCRHSHQFFKGTVPPRLLYDSKYGS